MTFVKGANERNESFKKINKQLYMTNKSPRTRLGTNNLRVEQIWGHYLPLDGMVNIPTYLVWASWVRNGSTFLSDNRYFEIQT